MSSTRSSIDLELCVICGDKKVTVSGRSEIGKKLITNLLRCLSLSHQFKSNGEAYENINLCFKCKYTLEEWTYAEGQAGSGFSANRARQIKANFLVKILESSPEKSVSSASSVSQRIRQLIYDRFNVFVNADRLELSREQMDQISQQQSTRHQNASTLKQSDSSKSQEYLQSDSSSSAVSVSDVEIIGDDSDDEIGKILPRQTRASGRRKIGDDDECQVISSETNDADHNPTQQARCSDEGSAQADMNPVEKFQRNHPMPPDFIPKKHKSGRYRYGKCCAKEDGNEVKCSECTWSVPMESDDGVSCWWKIREHMRKSHPERAPCIPPVRDLEVKCIGGDKFRYGQATMTRFLESDVECYKCDACEEGFRTKFAKKCCMVHIRSHHSELAPVNPYYQEKAILVKENLVRYAAAYLEKQSDTEIMCQVCSFVSTGQHAQKSSMLHVRRHHPVLAPVIISAGSSVRRKTGPEKSHIVISVSSSEEEKEDQSNEQARQDSDGPVEIFQMNNPVPPDFIPNKNRMGNCYSYGKCSATEDGNEVKCSECSFSVPVETNGLSSWWRIREHMRKKHSERVPCIPPPEKKRKQVEDKYQYGQVTMTRVTELEEERYKCSVCRSTFGKKWARIAFITHVRRRHPELARFSPYCQEKPVFLKKSLIRYAAAYLKKLSDMEVMCQVCSLLLTGRQPENIVGHVRACHSVLAPVVIGAPAQTSPNKPASQPIKEAIRRKCAASKEARVIGDSLNEDSHSRPKSKCNLESWKKRTKGRIGIAGDEDSTTESSSDESDDSEEEFFIPNINRKDGFECPLCGDTRHLKMNFIVHLKWHAGDVEEDSPR